MPACGAAACHAPLWLRQADGDSFHQQLAGGERGQLLRRLCDAGSLPRTAFVTCGAGRRHLAPRAARGPTASSGEHWDMSGDSMNERFIGPELCCLGLGMLCSCPPCRAGTAIGLLRV